ncbi:MAG: transglycosylase domain-containing protein [Persicimonas sp.]
MSNDDPSSDTSPTRRASRWPLNLALVAGLVGCLLAVSYLARTSLFIGPTVNHHVSRLAKSRDLNLSVQGMHPSGLTGVRLEHVQLDARRGSYLLEADLGAVEVTPSILTFVKKGRLEPESVEVDGGHIRITRRKSSPEDDPQEPAKGESDRGGDEGDAEQAEADEVSTLAARALLRDVSISIRPAPLPGTTRPIWFERAELVLGPGQSEAVRARFKEGYGRLPDNTPFSVMEASRDGPSAYVVDLEEGGTRLDDWFDVDLPFRARVYGMIVCPECEPARLDLIEPRLEGPRKLWADAEQLSLSADHRELRTSVPHITFRRDERRLDYDLRHLEAVWDSGTSTAIFQGDLLDAQGGRASFAANWSSQWGVLESNTTMHKFDTSGLWEPLGLDGRLEGGRWSGRLESSWEPAVDLAELTFDLRSDALTLKVPFVASAPLEFGELDLEFDALVQPVVRTVSVSEGEAVLGEAGPISFNGYATDARGGWVFDTHAAADDLDAQRLREGLPPALTAAARQTDFVGDFDFDISAAGHTAYPDDLSLAVNFDGDVELRDEEGVGDILSLREDGPPAGELPGPLSRRLTRETWVAYESLPHHIPRVLTAAEDAHFFHHDGFDWQGVRRAMVHNVRAGRVLRGGSTLSQQLAKNLFLNHERTLGRKLQEAYVTWRLEAALSKERIFELYVNMVDWGPDVRGIREAAQYYFDKRPTELDIPETALLGTILPGPSLYGSQIREGYLPSSRLEKFEHIISNLRFLDVIDGATYQRWYDAAKEGQIAGLDLTVCRDDEHAPDGAPDCS